MLQAYERKLYLIGLYETTGQIIAISFILLCHIYCYLIDSPIKCGCFDTTIHLIEYWQDFANYYAIQHRVSSVIMPFEIITAYEKSVINTLFIPQYNYL